MATSINLSLTDELRRFIDSQVGDGSLYATPCEFLRDLIREKKHALKPGNFEQGQRGESVSVRLPIPQSIPLLTT